MFDKRNAGEWNLMVFFACAPQKQAKETAKRLQVKLFPIFQFEQQRIFVLKFTLVYKCPENFQCFLSLMNSLCFISILLSISLSRAQL